MRVHFGPGESITAPAAAVLVTAGLLTSCAGDPDPSNSVPNASGPQSDPATTSQPATVGNEVRPGCGTYCQNAGPIRTSQDDSTTTPAATIVSTGTVTADPDGYLPVTVTCNLPVQCKGALLVMLEPFEFETSTKLGRADLLIEPGATQTFGIPLPAEVMAYLDSHGPTTAWVTADTGLTTPALCEDTPAPASMCPINELSRAELTIAAAGSR